MPVIVKIMPNPVCAPDRLVAVLVYDGLCAFEFGIAAEIFGLDRPEMGPDWYRFLTCAETPGALRTNAGLRVRAEAGLDRFADAETIVIPGWRTDGMPPSDILRRAMLDAHARGVRIVTICSGVFLPAALGLLNGRRATTHWRYAQRLRDLYPDIIVDADVLYVDGGDILTSAGSAAGVDLLLHVVRKDFGAEVANTVARRLVMVPHREGGQAQYIERPVPARADGRLAPLLDAVRASPADDWTIARMATDAAMSERTFLRRFVELTASNPGAWVQSVRIDAARHLLETTGIGLDDIAVTVGFGSAGNLRHHFRARLGVTPTTYRKRFARGAPVARPD